MTQEYDSADLSMIFAKVCERLIDAAPHLNELDAQLGDGDLGTTLRAVATALQGELCNMPLPISDFMEKISQIIAGVSGSSFSAIMMAGVNRVAAETNGQNTLLSTQISDLIRLAMESMMGAGGANLGDKTVLDGLNGIADAIDRETDHTKLASAADEALSRIMKDFKSKPCKIGRARLAGDRSIGLDDPGMTALKHMIEAINGSHDSGSDFTGGVDAH